MKGCFTSSWILVVDTVSRWQCHADQFGTICPTMTNAMKKIWWCPIMLLGVAQETNRSIVRFCATLTQSLKRILKRKKKNFRTWEQWKLLLLLFNVWLVECGRYFADATLVDHVSCCGVVWVSQQTCWWCGWLNKIYDVVVECDVKKKSLLFYFLWFFRKRPLAIKNIYSTFNVMSGSSKIGLTGN